MRNILFKGITNDDEKEIRFTKFQQEDARSLAKH